MSRNIGIFYHESGHVDRFLYNAYHDIWQILRPNIPVLTVTKDTMEAENFICLEGESIPAGIMAKIIMLRSVYDSGAQTLIREVNEQHIAFEQVPLDYLVETKRLAHRPYVACVEMRVWERVTREYIVWFKNTNLEVIASMICGALLVLEKNGLINKVKVGPRPKGKRDSMIIENIKELLGDLNGKIEYI